MRKAVVVAAALAILAAVNASIASREAIVADGKVVLLELAPVDPRPLMQGDYMPLRFRVATEAFGGTRGTHPADGRLVVSISPEGVAKFVRFDEGAPLAPGELRLRYRWREDPRFATNAFFFEEGKASRFAAARFGEFRVGDDGEMILTGLRDAERRPL
ncbi:MAG: GDYXXLXY domain-containing protein [Burkholderiales bacterium]